MKKLISVLFLMIQIVFCYAQNLETIKDTPKNIKFGGGLRLSTQFYDVSGIEARRSPFSWVVSGNARLSVGQFKIPVRFTFRDQKFNVNGPSYNKFGISPYYKWARLHLGHRMINFSKYSLNGKSFFGAGIELKPKYFRLSAFKGSFQNPLAQHDTLVYGGILIPTYKRKAMGIKIGVGGTHNYFDLSLLRIKDDEETDINIKSSNLKPHDNLVVGTDWRFRLWKTASFYGSINLSALTENTSLESLPINNESFESFAKYYEPNASTKVSIAGDLGMSFQLKAIRFGLNYRRVEPNYRSLGISYIQSDVESWTTNTNFSLFKRKVSINAQVGIERNNLRNLDLLSRKRLISSLRVFWRASKAFNIMGHYANYQYESTDGLVNINDTLRYVNVSKLAGLNINYKQKGKHYNYGLFTSLQRQNIEDQSPIVNLGTDILSYQFSVGGSISLNDLEMSFRPSLNYNRYLITDKLQERYGIGLRVNKTFFKKKLKLIYNTRYNKNDEDKFRNGFVLTNKLSSRYQLTKKQSFNFSISHLIKRAIVGREYNEVRGGLNYSIRF